eukprot:TRINITY_DN798_c9_g1_i1.p1 TRINITY_DN798_c9_g1~~TRINITY_DN798_c9_g1_i1.p1  ORF type:complete len:809 (+),score=222.13 TRINITY_DN798_c9_g1_i1:253-2679(+)
MNTSTDDLPPPILTEATNRQPSLKRGTATPKGPVLFEGEEMDRNSKRRSQRLSLKPEAMAELSEEIRKEAERAAAEEQQYPSLPGMDVDPNEVDDPIRSMRVSEMLQALDRTTEELMGTRVSNEELMGFLEMGEKRIVDLAVKVKLLEDQNEKMAIRESDQHNQIEELKHTLSQALELKSKSDNELEMSKQELSNRHDEVEDLRMTLETVRQERNRELEVSADVRRSLEIKEEQSRKEKEKLVSEHRVTVQNSERERKRLQERVDDWHRKADGHSNKAKQYEKDIKDKTREAEKISQDYASLQRTHKTGMQKMEIELANGKSHIQEEMTRLFHWQKELSEQSDKLKKADTKLSKEKENIKKAICDSVREIQQQRDSEHRLLLDIKAQYEQELSTQFDARQRELDEHWRQKETVELEQLEERRSALDAELAAKTQKATENRQRLERYSKNLEGYGRRLKAEYESWQREKSQVYQVLDEAQQEREEVEASLKQQISDLTATVQDYHVQLEGKKAVIVSLTERIQESTQEAAQLKEDLDSAVEREKDCEEKIAELSGENGRLIDDNTVLERNFNELKLEHDQLLEEMTYMRSREEEERELRRKTNEMLLASYKIKNPGSNMMISPGTHGGQSIEEIDLLCWKCHSRTLEEEGSGLLTRTREARKQMRALTTERKKLQADKDLFLKAHKLDANRLIDETMTIRKEREQLKKDTEILIAERKALSPETQIRPSLSSNTDLISESWVTLDDDNIIDPDHNPTDVIDATPVNEPVLEASRRRKKDLIYLKSICSTPKNLPSSIRDSTHTDASNYY